MRVPADKLRRTVWSRNALLRRFARNAGGSVAVEMAFILPIFAAMAFLTWDAGTVYTQYNRALSNLYSVGDIITTRTQDVTCNQLDAISELVYDSYAHGNWARRIQDGDDFQADGALDFRFRIVMIRAETQPSGTVRGRTEWEYVRASQTAREPGQLIDIPNEMRIDGMRYVHVEGFIYLRPTFNYLGIFDMNPDPDREDGLMEMDQFFPIRYVPNIDLIEEPGDEFDAKCKG
ncbi:MAG: pilus assembly protein [Phyllobacteriaceae bacterium]|jgi:Flp pilus assembly protein TadG|nr:pilus assembly protein [Phyllobacteriaceae bacterium]